MQTVSLEIPATTFAALGESPVKKFSELKNKRTLFELRSPYKNCIVKFVIAAEDIAILCEASDNIFEAARSAVKLIDYLENVEPEILVYEFDLDVRKWLPLHIETRKLGVISDQPYLIAINQMQGMSLGGLDL